MACTNVYHDEVNCQEADLPIEEWCEECKVELDDVDDSDYEPDDEPDRYLPDDNPGCNDVPRH